MIFSRFDVRVLPSPHAIAIGMVSGLWTASAFAILPLLGIRAVPPLATLRRAVEPTRVRWDGLRIAAALIVPASVVGLAAVQVGSLLHAAAFAAGCVGALAVLWLASLGLIASARRWTPTRWPYLVRQGLANLHRPANQTVTVVLALGFGAFILTTLFTAQQNLLRIIRVEDATARPNLVLFDIQTEQRPVIDSVLHAEDLTGSEYTPIVPMRISEIKGESATSILARDTTHIGRGGRGSDGAGAPTWAARREFRSTWRMERGPGERVTSGHWFTGGNGHRR